MRACYVLTLLYIRGRGARNTVASVSNPKTKAFLKKRDFNPLIFKIQFQSSNTLYTEQGNMFSKRRTCLLAAAFLVSCYLLYSAPNTETTEVEDDNDPIVPDQALVLDTCEDRQTFGDLTQKAFFVFPRTDFTDATVFSNMFYYLGLKYKQSFAMHVQHPIHWNGLSNGEDHASDIQETETDPRIVCQSLPYNPSNINMVFKGAFRSSQKVVLGFLRDPLETFFACLQSKVERQRRLDDKSISLMLDKNVNDYMDGFLGNVLVQKLYIPPQSCNNRLSYHLGLTDYAFKNEFNTKYEGVLEKLTHYALRNIKDFLIYERLRKVLFLYREKYCLGPEEDWLYLPRVRENFVGLGLGVMTPATKLRLEHFLRYDYAIYTRVLSDFDKQFASNMALNPSFESSFEEFKSKLQTFTNSCCLRTMAADDSKGRTYQLTPEGENEIQCATINGLNSLNANIVLQIQDSKIGGKIKDLIDNDGSYPQFLTIVRDSIPEEEGLTRII
eukprot:sb/3479454/